MKKKLSYSRTDEGEPNPMDRALGLRVRAMRKELGISQDVLAGSIGLTFQQIQKYEHGTNRISFSRMVDIAKALHISVPDLIEPLVGKVGQSVTKSAKHFNLLRDPRSLELLTLFDSMPDAKQKTAVLRFMREMVRAATVT